MTANMKAPLVLEIENKVGRQIVISSDKYSTKETVIKAEPKAEV
jgi:flagellar assembly factor FliW